MELIFERLFPFSRINIAYIILYIAYIITYIKHSLYNIILHKRTYLI